MNAPFVVRGRLLHFRADPAQAGEGATVQAEDGALAVEDGRIVASGEARDVLAGRADWRAIDHRPHLLAPGFVDPHLHFPQVRVIASYGAQLLAWLNDYTFPEEAKFVDRRYAERAARFLFDELFANGTTTGCVYSSSHMEATDAFFAESERRGARMAAGKTMMDRNAPAGVLDTAKRGYDESRALIERWHGRGRQIYAVTPRFAITSSPEQLEAAGALARENPTCLVQTHLSENHAEIAAVEGLFPHALDYTDVYEGFGLVGPRTLLGHCIHLDVREWRALSERGAVAVHCPTSNLFLGSGLFDLAAAREAARPVRVAVATDVGGGTSYSMLRTMAEAYKVQQLRGLSVAPRDAFHMATRGNALAMGLGGTVGGLDAGHEADFVVLDSRATPAMAQRMATARTLDEELFVLMTLGDDRAVAETYVAGRPSKPRGDRAIE